MAVLSKKLITAYYGQGSLKYSYWNGCSTGGRQGLMMAQRYPGDYDGVVAGSSAIHWDKFQVQYAPGEIDRRLLLGCPLPG